MCFSFSTSQWAQNTPTATVYQWLHLWTPSLWPTPPLGLRKRMKCEWIYLLCIWFCSVAGVAVKNDFTNRLLFSQVQNSKHSPFHHGVITLHAHTIQVSLNPAGGQVWTPKITGETLKYLLSLDLRVNHVTHGSVVLVPVSVVRQMVESIKQEPMECAIEQPPLKKIKKEVSTFTLAGADFRKLEWHLSFRFLCWGRWKVEQTWVANVGQWLRVVFTFSTHHNVDEWLHDCDVFRLIGGIAVWEEPVYAVGRTRTSHTALFP